MMELPMNIPDPIAGTAQKPALCWPSFRGCALLLIVWAFLTLTSLNVAPLFDYDEAAHAQTALEMIHDGTWVLPTMNGRPFYEKPAFHFYFMSASFALFGENAVAARLPSALFTLATALFLLYAGRRIGQTELGMAASVIYVSMFMPAMLAHAAILDATLNFWVSLAVMSFFLWKQERKRRDAILAMLTAGIAVSVKGPVGFVIPLIVIGLDRLIAKDFGSSLRLFPWKWGVTAFLVGAMPWYVLVTITQGHEFLASFIVKDNLNRFAHAMEGHSGSWYYYLLILIPGTLPWVAWLPWWTVQTIARWNKKNASDDLSRLGLAWTVAVLFLFSVARTKLPHYISSIYPAIALGIAAQWRQQSPTHAWNRTASLLLLIICLPLAMALILLPAFYADLVRIVTHPRAVAVLSQPIRPESWIPVGGMFVAITVLLHFWQTKKFHFARTLTFYVIFGLLFQTTIVWTLAPFAGQLQQKPLMTIAAQIRAYPQSEPVYTLINHPSISFYSGRSSIRVSGAEIDDLCTKSYGPFLLVTYADQLPELLRYPLKVVLRQGDYLLLQYAPDH
jgi:4-amino-4-deoxy-L-arabinose transferase-like glycosyltransferase